MAPSVTLSIYTSSRLFPESFTKALIKIAKGIAWLALLLLALIVTMKLWKLVEKTSPNSTGYEDAADDEGRHSDS
jgi:hypothetical protein